MVKTVKSALAILLGVALLLMPGVAASGLAVPARCAAQKMSCCGMNKSCCRAKTAPEAPQSPALPAPGGSATQLQAAAAPQTSILTFPDLISSVRPCPSSSISTGRVSLYQRNCAYLI